MVRKLRRELGLLAFGLNHFRLPPGTVGREHDHADSNQEEAYVVLDGSGVMRVAGVDVPLEQGVVVRVDPGATRVPVAGPDGLEFVAVGAPLGGTYEPPSWG